MIHVTEDDMVMKLVVKKNQHKKPYLPKMLYHFLYTKYYLRMLELISIYFHKHYFNSEETKKSATHV